MVTRPSILLIDDSPSEQELLRLALAQTGLNIALYTEQDSDAAFHFLDHQAANVPGCYLGERTSVVSTARVEQAHSDRVRSASTETLPPASPSLPSLILLDLHLGRQNGCDLLKRLRSDDRFAALPVVVFTTSDDPADHANFYSYRTNGYVVKPGSFDGLIHCTGDLCRYWLTWNRPLMVETAC